jgi:hypothetical protein
MENISGLTGEEHTAARAREVIFLMILADIWNVPQREIEYGDLDKAGEGGSHDLRHEHCPRWNLHIVAVFQIRYEAQRLRPASRQ